MDHLYTEEINRKSTIRDVAAFLGISVTTVSRALSGKGRIGEETRKRVIDACEALNYRPNLLAKGLAKSKTYNLGVVLPADSNLTELPFFQVCLMGICETAASLDYDVVVTTTTEDQITLLKRLIENHKVDGVIVTRTVVNDLCIAYLKKQQVPFVLIGSCQDEGVIQVDSNHIGGCEELISKLIHKGCSRFAYIGGSRNHIVNQNRYLGFQRAIAENQMTEDKSMVFLDVTSRAFVDRAVDVIMQKRVDCIICTDDLICQRVLARLDQMKYAVPSDVKVASFYNSTALKSHNPPITTLDINRKELGAMAARRMVELLHHQQVPEKTLVNYEIQLKKSTK